MTNNIEKLLAQVERINDELFELQQTISDGVAVLTSRKIETQGLLNDEIYKVATNDLDAKPYGCGTSTINTARHKIKCVVSKQVKWDDAQIAEIFDMIQAANKDPFEYINRKLTVSETAYAGFNPEVKAVFDPARSVEASKPKITIERI